MVLRGTDVECARDGVIRGDSANLVAHMTTQKDRYHIIVKRYDPPSYGNRVGNGICSDSLSRVVLTAWLSEQTDV
jgi:hypothetical protein